MINQLIVFAFRWALNSFGLWLSYKVFGNGYGVLATPAGAGAFMVAGLIFSLVNALIRPVVVILSLPVILVTLGLFTVVVNGFMVWLAISITPNLQITFSHAIITGIILSLLNYLLSSIFELRMLEKEIN